MTKERRSPRAWPGVVWRRAQRPPVAPVGRPDPGLQQERTQLAWRRSILAFGVVAVAVFRAAYLDSLHIGVALALLGAGICAWLSLTTVRRRRWTWPSPREPESFHVLRDGTLPFLVTVMACALAVAVLLNAVDALA